MSRPITRLWTDGSCTSGGSGWSFVVEEKGRVLDERSGFIANATVNRAQLGAVLEALRYAADLPGAREVQVVTDSSYVVDGINSWLPQWLRNDWQPVGRRGGRSTKPIRNLAAWKQIAELSERLPRLRPVRKVKGHSGAQFNQLADRLARVAAGSEVR